MDVDPPPLYGQAAPPAADDAAALAAASDTNIKRYELEAVCVSNTRERGRRGPQKMMEEGLTAARGRKKKRRQGGEKNIQLKTHFLSLFSFSSPISTKKTQEHELRVETRPGHAVVVAVRLFRLKDTRVLIDVSLAAVVIDVKEEEKKHAHFFFFDLNQKK